MRINFVRQAYYYSVEDQCVTIGKGLCLKRIKNL